MTDRDAGVRRERTRCRRVQERAEERFTPTFDLVGPPHKACGIETSQSFGWCPSSRIGPPVPSRIFRLTRNTPNVLVCSVPSGGAQWCGRYASICFNLASYCRQPYHRANTEDQLWIRNLHSFGAKHNSYLRKVLLDRNQFLQEDGSALLFFQLLVGRSPLKHVPLRKNRLRLGAERMPI